MVLWSCSYLPMPISVSTFQVYRFSCLCGVANLSIRARGSSIPKKVILEKSGPRTGCVREDMLGV